MNPTETKAIDSMQHPALSEWTLIVDWSGNDDADDDHASEQTQQEHLVVSAMQSRALVTGPRSSAYFEALFRSHMREQARRTIRLHMPDQAHACLFSVLMDYLCNDDMAIDETSCPHMENLPILFHFGLYFQVDTLCQDVLEHFTRRYTIRAPWLDHPSWPLFLQRLQQIPLVPVQVVNAVAHSLTVSMTISSFMVHDFWSCLYQLVSLLEWEWMARLVKVHTQVHQPEAKEQEHDPHGVRIRVAAIHAWCVSHAHPVIDDDRDAVPILERLVTPESVPTLFGVDETMVLGLLQYEKMNSKHHQSHPNNHPSWLEQLAVPYYEQHHATLVHKEQWQDYWDSVGTRTIPTTTLELPMSNGV